MFPHTQAESSHSQEFLKFSVFLANIEIAEDLKIELEVNSVFLISTSTCRQMA